MDIQYRSACNTDIEELVGLRRAYLRSDFGKIEKDVEDAVANQLPGYFARHLQNDLFAPVAQCDGKLVGTCWLLVVEKPASVAFPHGRTGAIFNVYVDPRYRRKGIARRLMLMLIDKAKELELDRLELRATSMGHDLYRSIGFVDDESSHTAMNYKLGEE